MDSQGGIEIERKFDVDGPASVPALDALPGVARVEPPVEQRLEAVYFDTIDLALAARHLTLRRRTGGDDAGWHLKVPAGGQARREIHAPLLAAATVPDALLQRVRAYVRDRPLHPVVRLNTQRFVHRLLAADGTVLAEVSDDRVEAELLTPEVAHLSWREWEIELVAGDPALLDEAEALLATGGIHRSPHPSKLARALGDRFPQAGPPAPPRPTGRGAAGDVLRATLHTQVEALLEQDARVRQDAVDSVHTMRIATRRLRSALRTYRPLLDEGVAERLDRELGWLAGVLGTTRDLEVLRHRLKDLVARQPTNLVLGPVSERIDTHFETDLTKARRTAVEALGDTRYFRLLDALDALRAAPPLTALAAKPAKTVVPRLIGKDLKRLRRSVRAVRKAPEGPTRDLALHAVRKKAKHLRYAAETAIPLGRKRALRVAKFAKRLQTILGDHQDSVIARDLLLRVSSEAYLLGENAFSYGRLHTLESLTAAEDEARFHRAWKKHF